MNPIGPAQISPADQSKISPSQDCFPPFLGGFSPVRSFRIATWLSAGENNGLLTLPLTTFASPSNPATPLLDAWRKTAAASDLIGIRGDFSLGLPL